MVTIFLRVKIVKKGKNIGYELFLRDTNGNSGNHTHKAIVDSGSKVAWELEKKSGIKDIARIWVSDKNPAGKVFKTEPQRVGLRKIFIVDIVETRKELEDEYFITFVTDNGTVVSIDPFIRIPPPR
ncbi:MAG: hypothetical protein IPN68_19040 [Bacteroidetes bacterium]|nr:hypothetical protein [Bacteroidota bacterium]